MVNNGDCDAWLVSGASGAGWGKSRELTYRPRAIHERWTLRIGQYCRVRMCSIISWDVTKLVVDDVARLGQVEYTGYRRIMLRCPINALSEVYKTATEGATTRKELARSSLL